MLSIESFQFLEDLKSNNNRDWFQNNKKRYEIFKKEYHQLIQDFLELMKPNDATLSLLEVKNCAFRINRDIRFSKDKSPYKTHLGVWMNTNYGNSNGPGYYVHIEKGKSFIAGGLYSPESDELKKIRKEIAFFYDDLEAIVNEKSFKSVFGNLEHNESNSLKNAPKGYEKDHPAIEFLKLKSFVAVYKFDDSELQNKDFIEDASKKLLVLKPFLTFLNRGLETD